MVGPDGECNDGTPARAGARAPPPQQPLARRLPPKIVSELREKGGLCCRPCALGELNVGDVAVLGGQAGREGHASPWDLVRSRVIL